MTRMVMAGRYEPWLSAGGGDEERERERKRSDSYRLTLYELLPCKDEVCCDSIDVVMLFTQGNSTGNTNCC